MKQLLKLSIVFVLILGIFIPTATSVDAATTYSATVNADILNVREKASTKSKKVGSLKRGNKVTVYNKLSSGWSEIRYKGKKAYVSTKYLKFSTSLTVNQHNYKNNSKLKYAQVSGMKNTTAQKKINQVLLNDAKDAYKAYQQMLQDEKEIQGDDFCIEFPYSCDFDYQTYYKVKYTENNKLSILVYDYLYEGGAHGMGWVTSYNFSTTTGKQIKITNVFDSKSDYTNVRKYAYNYMKKHDDVFYVNKESDVPVHKSSQFFYTTGGIYLVFQEYEVAPYAAGFPQVKIPSKIY